METELKANYDSRKSFYGKAIVITEGNKIILRSYSTDVAYIENGILSSNVVVKGSYSHTTLRHIKEFLKQNGFKAENNKQILKDYSPTEKQINKDSLERKQKDDSMLKTVGIVASLGDIFSDNKKGANDWKVRMLKAGLENKGLIMPKDWNSLTEKDKEHRLNGVINIATGKE